MCTLTAAITTRRTFATLPEPPHPRTRIGKTCVNTTARAFIAAALQYTARMHRALLALAIQLACTDHGDTAPPSAPTSASIPDSSFASPPAPTPPAAPAALNLPASDPIVTPVHKPGDIPAPTVHRLPDGREFIHDLYRDRISIRDAANHATDLGEVTLLAVPGLGSLILPKDADGRPRYHDVDPTAPRLRLLWAPPADVHPILAGLDRGAPLFYLRRDDRTAIDLVRVPAPGVAETRTIKLGVPFIPASSDAVRGDRILLVGVTPRTRTTMDWTGPGITEPVVVLDLTAAQTRRIGDARGDWSMSTSIPHPYVAVQWTDHDRHGRGSWFAEACVNRVDPASERLTACTPAKP